METISIDQIKNLLAQGSKLGGEVGFFYSNITNYVIGTLLFITILYAIRYLPFMKAIHEYAKMETQVDRDSSEFMKIFRNPATRIKINISILAGIFVLMLGYAFLAFITACFPFLVWSKGINISIFGTSMVCLGVFALEFWALWVLNRLKEQIAKAINIDKDITHTIVNS